VEISLEISIYQCLNSWIRSIPKGKLSEERLGPVIIQRLI